MTASNIVFQHNIDNGIGNAETPGLCLSQFELHFNGANFCENTMNFYECWLSSDECFYSIWVIETFRLNLKIKTATFGSYFLSFAKYGSNTVNAFQNFRIKMCFYLPGVFQKLILLSVFKKTKATKLDLAWCLPPSMLIRTCSMPPLKLRFVESHT